VRQAESTKKGVQQDSNEKGCNWVIYAVKWERTKVERNGSKKRI